MNLAQNVCLDDFQVKFGTGSLMMYISRSSDFLKFFSLGQFLNNYWSYRVIFVTCEMIVFRSVSQLLMLLQPVILNKCIHLSMAS